MRRIIEAHFPDIPEKLAENAIRTFYELRGIDGVEKKPATRELINWLRALQADPDFRKGEMLEREIPYLGVLFKKSADYLKSMQMISKRGFFR